MTTARAARTVAVVLNYRTAELTIEAVHSLAASGQPPNEIVVVDNASGDGSPERLASSLPDVRIIVAATNGGFSAGCNLGIREALTRDAARVFLLNSDARVASDAMAILHGVLDTRSEVGIAGPAIVDQGSNGTVESLGIAYNEITGRMRHIGFGLTTSALTNEGVSTVTGISGCAMLIRREVFESTGLFAEEYFFGFEDLDFCLRARGAGWACACAQATRVFHHSNQSIGRRSPRRTYFAVRNHLLLASRFPAHQARLAQLARNASVVGLNTAHALFVSDVPRRAGLPALWRGILDHLRGRYGEGGSGFRF